MSTLFLKHENLFDDITENPLYTKGIFTFILRDENRSIEETLRLVEESFGLIDMEGNELMERDLIAYCGVDCGACEDYVNGKCPSCRKTDWKEDDICLPVRCCREKGIDHCGMCSEFPCRDMEDFYNEFDSHIDAYLRMCEMSGRFED